MADTNLQTGGQAAPKTAEEKKAFNATRRKSRLDGLHRAPVPVDTVKDEVIASVEDATAAAKGRRESKIAPVLKQETDLIKDKAGVGTGKVSPRDEKHIKVNVKNFAILQKKEIKSTYKIKETLGQGSFGCVKRVMHRDLAEDRALKIIKRTSVTSD